MLSEEHDRRLAQGATTIDSAIDLALMGRERLLNSKDNDKMIQS